MNLIQVLTWSFIIIFVLAFFFPILWILVVIIALIGSFTIYATVRVANTNFRCHSELENGIKNFQFEGEDSTILKGVSLGDYRQYYENSDYVNNAKQRIFDAARDYNKDKHGIQATCFTYEDYDGKLMRGIIGVNNNSALFFGATPIKLEYDEDEGTETFLPMDSDPILISKYYGIDIDIYA